MELLLPRKFQTFLSFFYSRKILHTSDFKKLSDRKLSENDSTVEDIIPDA